ACSAIALAIASADRNRRANLSRAGLERLLGPQRLAGLWYFCCDTSRRMAPRLGSQTRKVGRGVLTAPRDPEGIPLCRLHRWQPYIRLDYPLRNRVPRQTRDV